MDAVEQVLREHEPWYDSFDQNTDAWGCRCDNKTGYLTRDQVIAKHIMPKVRAAIDGRPELRPADVQRKMDANGNLLRGSSARQIWDDVDKLINYCRANNLNNLATAYEAYEDERRRQGRAIENLDTQLTALATGLMEAKAEHGKLVSILKRGGMDLDVLIATDDIFGNGGT